MLALRKRWKKEEDVIVLDEGGKGAKRCTCQADSIVQGWRGRGKENRGKNRYCEKFTLRTRWAAPIVRPSVQKKNDSSI